MFKKIVIYSLANVGYGEIEEKKPNIPGILTFATSSLIYDKLKDNKMLPFSYEDKQEYIFHLLTQTFINSLVYNDNYKLIIIDDLLVLATIYFSDNILVNY